MLNLMDKKIFRILCSDCLFYWANKFNKYLDNDDIQSNLVDSKSLGLEVLFQSI